MEYLNLSRNKLSGGIPAELGAAPQLREAYLNDNALTGSVPAGLGAGGLWILDVQRNELSGALPAGLKGLLALRTKGNAFTCAAPELRRIQLNDFAALPDCGAATATPTPTPTATPTSTATPTTTPTYTLSVTPRPVNGAFVITPAVASYAAGSRVDVLAKPDTGYELTAWGGDCATTAATKTVCTLTMNANKTVSATFAKKKPAAGRPPAPELLVVTTGNRGEVLLEWTPGGDTAGVTRWQYRRQEVSAQGVTGAWTAWANVPGSGAATRSYRVTGLRSFTQFWFEVRAVAGSFTGSSSGRVTGITPHVGADGIPEMLPGQIVEGGRAWRIHGGRTVIDVPAGTRLVAGRGALVAGRAVVAFSDVASGSAQWVDIDRAEGLGREIVTPPQAANAIQAASGGGTARDVGAIFDAIMASARLVPVK